MCIINYTLILYLHHTDCSVVNPEIENKTLRLLLLNQGRFKLNRTRTCSTVRDLVINFFFCADLPLSICFDLLWLCRFYLECHRKEGKKYKHLSIYLKTHFQHPFYLRIWRLFYPYFPVFDKQQSAICQDQHRFPTKDEVRIFLGLSMQLSYEYLRRPSIPSFQFITLSLKLCEFDARSI